MTSDKQFITIQNVEKIYPNGEKAVYNFNLDIARNEFIVIVGPSGCGKSTTLRMIAGLEDITSGEIRMEGELLNFKPCKDRKMAIVFQSYALYPQMNVFGNIAFPLTINKYPAPVTDETLFSCNEVKTLVKQSNFAALVQLLSEISAERGGKRAERVATALNISLSGAERLLKLYARFGDSAEQWLAELQRQEEAQRSANQQKGIALNESFHVVDAEGKEVIRPRKLTPFEIKKKVYETAEKLDLTPYLDKLPRELSGGQMQRVALGRAIIKNVPVFLMDEPLSNLDAKLRLTMRSEIVKLHNRIGATTVYVTHDQTEAMTMADRIVVMSRGFIQQIDSPEDVYSAPANLFVAKFIGSPAMNLWDMRFDRDAATLTCGDFTLAVGKEFVRRYDEFYAEKTREFEQICSDFDETAREKINRILSATGEQPQNKKVKSKNLFDKIKRLFAKKSKEPAGPSAEEQLAREKLDALRNCLEGGTVAVGIRPERIVIEKVVEGKNYNGWYVTKPTICELLGGEYSVHFDFCGKDTVARLDANSPVTPSDEIAVKFDFETMYVFDPITGDVIKGLTR